MSAILRERGSKNEKLQIWRTEKKHKLVSKIPSYRVIFLKLMMKWKLLEQRVDRAQQSTFYSAQSRKKNKKTASLSTQILG